MRSCAKLFQSHGPLAFDMQWHFFAAVVLLMAAYTLQRDQHVRIDILAHRLGERGLYPKRNNPIFGTVQIGGKPTKGSDGKGYTTLSSPMDQAP